MANLIIKLNEDHGIKYDDILLVGHSLGGQTSGFVGKIIKKKTEQTLPRIIALDPAGPYFDTRPEEKRLNKNDAKVVQVIHSDGGTFGFLKSCGSIDFFPNGGSSQPGCKRIDLLDITSVVEPGKCYWFELNKVMLEWLIYNNICKEMFAKSEITYGVTESG